MAQQGSSTGAENIGDAAQEPRFLRAYEETLRKFEHLRSGAFSDDEDSESQILLMMPSYDDSPVHPDGQGPAWYELEMKLREYWKRVECFHYDPSFGLGTVAGERIQSSRGVVLIVNEPTWVESIASEPAARQQHINWAINYAKAIPLQAFVWNPDTDGGEGPERIVPIVMVLVGPQDGQLLPRWTNLKSDTVIYSPYDRSLLGCIPELIFDQHHWPADRFPTSSTSSSEVSTRRGKIEDGNEGT